MSRHRTALATLALGFVMAAAVQVLVPAGLPLYDGVVVQEPYRYLSPRDGQAGNPTSYRATLPVEEGRSPALGAATEEVPPQAQLIAAPGAFVLPPGVSAITVTIEPIPPPGPGEVGGNVYRIQVTDQGGLVLAPASGAVPKVVLRAPGDLLRARIGQFAGGAWQDLVTSHGGQSAIYLATPTALGDFAMLGTPVTPPDAGLDLRLVAIGLLVALGSAGLLLFAFFRPRRRPVPVDPRRSGRELPRRAGGGAGERRPAATSNRRTIDAAPQGERSMTRRVLLVGFVAALVFGACSGPARSPAASANGEVRVGAVFPLAGSAATLAKQQLLGAQIAADLANSDARLAGHRIVLDVRDLESGADAPAVMQSLRKAGASVVIGAYSSELSIAASQAADAAGLVYWEGGAVADRLTGRGLPRVFRVGASGANLGSNSAAFAAAELAPRLGKTASQLRVAIVNAQDDYARSVADAAASTAASDRLSVVLRTSYNLYAPDWSGVMAELSRSRPDVIILASHIPDGIAFRRAMLAARVRVGALIGSTMAECSPDFAGDLGPAAVGIFASDRPTGGFQAAALTSSARSLYQRFAVEWRRRTPVSSSSARGSSSDRYGDDSNGAGANAGDPYDTDRSSNYSIRGPIEAGSAEAGPTEEGLSGYTAAWALFESVLPAAARSGSLDAEAVAAAARTLDLPRGALPNGAGLRFSGDTLTLGQNERAAAVIWQWQAVRSYAFVWPQTYATGSIAFVPLGE